MAEEKPEFELLDGAKTTGHVVRNRKGKAVLLAKYEEVDGQTKTNGSPVMRLTFESEAMDKNYREKIIRAIIESSEGELTGNRIDSYAINGRDVDKIKPGEPPRPRQNKMLGDKTPEVVKFYKKWRTQEFYARYGVLLDSNGEPRTAHCVRVEQGLVQPDAGVPFKVLGDGRDALTTNIVENEEGILARRATCITFTTSEVVGANGDDDEDEDE